MDSIVLFLRDDILPKEKGEADKVRRKAPQFWLFLDQKLYKRSFFGAIFAVHPSQSSGAIPRRVARRNLSEPYRRHILVSRGPYLGILVAQYAKRSTRVREGV